MNWSEIIVAILAVFGSYVGNMAATRKKDQEMAIKDAEHEQHQKDQLTAILKEQEEIKKRLDAHNNYAQKFAENNVAMTAMAKDIESVQKDIAFFKSRIENK